MNPYTTQERLEHERLCQELAALRQEWQIGRGYLADCLEAIADLGAVRQLPAATGAAIDRLLQIRRDVLIVLGDRVQEEA
jgi:hypothetical protein